MDDHLVVDDALTDPAAGDGAQEQPEPMPEPVAAALWYGTYAIYPDGRGGVVAVIQDGQTGSVQRYLAPPLVLRALRARFPVLRRAEPTGPAPH